MSRVVNVHEAKTQFSKLLDMAHHGQEIILAKSGKPYARLMPLAPVAVERKPGRLRGTVSADFFEPLVEDEVQAWDSR